MGHPNDPVVFNHTVEALFQRALARHLTPRGKARLLAIGLDLERRLDPAYPFDVWMRALRIAAEDQYPLEPVEQALHHLGTRFLDGYRETLLGRALLTLIRVLGPRRTVLRATQNFRSGNNYTTTKVSDRGPTEMELWLNEVGPYPTFTAGIIEGALRQTGVVPAVDIVAHDGHACTYRIRWEPSASHTSPTPVS